jgi:hypothetical protein
MPCSFVDLRIYLLHTSLVLSVLSACLHTRTLQKIHCKGKQERKGGKTVLFERLHMPVEMAESTIEVREDALDCLALPTARGEECEEAGTVTASDAPRERERERARESERERERERAGGPVAS